MEWVGPTRKAIPNVTELDYPLVNQFQMLGYRMTVHTVLSYLSLFRRWITSPRFVVGRDDARDIVGAYRQ